MPSYNYKDEAALAFENNKRRLRAEGQIILSAIMNEALSEMSQQFGAALARGEILGISGSQEEMKSFLRSAAQKELKAAKVAG